MRQQQAFQVLDRMGLEQQAKAFHLCAASGLLIARCEDHWETGGRRRWISRTSSGPFKPPGIISDSNPITSNISAVNTATCLSSSTTRTQPRFCFDNGLACVACAAKDISSAKSRWRTPNHPSPICRMCFVSVFAVTWKVSSTLALVIVRGTQFIACLR